MKAHTGTSDKQEAHNIVVETHSVFVMRSLIEIGSYSLTDSTRLVLFQAVVI